jgi:hypothetical protein
MCSDSILQESQYDAQKHDSLLDESSRSIISQLPVTQFFIHTNTLAHARPAVHPTNPNANPSRLPP